MKLIANIKAMGNALMLITRQHVNLKDGEYEVTIRELGDSKSDNQRRMVWGLVMEICKAINGNTADKDIVYSQILEMAGASYDIFTLQKKAFEDGALDKRGLTHYRVIKDANGFVSVMVFYGLSMMNTKEASQLIDTALRYASEVGIDTDDDYWKGMLEKCK